MAGLNMERSTGSRVVSHNVQHGRPRLGGHCHAADGPRPRPLGGRQASRKRAQGARRAAVANHGRCLAQLALGITRSCLPQRTRYAYVTLGRGRSPGCRGSRCRAEVPESSWPKCLAPHAAPQHRNAPASVGRGDRRGPCLHVHALDRLDLVDNHNQPFVGWAGAGAATGRPWRSAARRHPGTTSRRADPAVCQHRRGATRWPCSTGP